jgi:hypothetical protein
MERAGRLDLRTLLLGGLVIGGLVQVGLAFPSAALPVLLGGLALLATVIWARRGTPEGTSSDEPVLARRDVAPGTAALVLGGLLVIALALRLYTLTDRPTWSDEMWTLRNIYTSDWGELFRAAFDDYWPPLFYVLLNAIARVADTSLLWLRLPSVVFGVISIAVMYRLGLLLFGSRAVALVAAALLTGLTSHVLYSQEARVYSMQVMLALLSAYFFYRSFWERRISPAFIISTFLLTWSHSFASWYFVAGQCVYVVLAGWIWKDRPAMMRGILSQVIVFALWLPLTGFFLQARLSREIVVPTYWATGEETPGLLDLIEQYQGLAVRSWAGAAFMVVFLCLAMWWAWRVHAARPARQTDSRPGAAAGEAGFPQAVTFLLCWCIVPVLFSLVVTVATSMNTFGAIRYHLTVAPGLCLLAAAGFATLQTRTQLAMAASVVVLLPLAELPRYYTSFMRDAVDQAAALVREQSTPDEQIYVGNEFRIFSYYFRGIFPRIGSAQWDSLKAAHAHLADRPTLESPKYADTYAFEAMSPRIVTYEFFRGDYTPPYARFIEAERARGGLRGSFWLVLEPEDDGRVLEALERDGVPCRNPMVYDFSGVELVRCNPPPHAYEPQGP